MQSVSLPKSLRGDSSPVIAIDSPFPPLKTEHRYRGVYERAGFDVNLRRESPSEDRHFHPKQSPISPAGSGKNAYSPANISKKDPALPHHHVNSTRSSGNGQGKSSPLGFGDAQQVYTSHFRSPDRATANSSPTGSVAPYSQYTSSTSLPSQPSTSGRTHIKQFQPEKQNPRLHSGSSTRSHEEYNDRNKKNLKLYIPEAEQSPHNAAEVSTEASVVTGSPFDGVLGSRGSTPYSSTNSSEHFVHKTDSSSPVSVKTSELTQRAPYPVYDSEGNPASGIEYSLAGLRNDVKKHKAFDPRGMNSSGSLNRSATRAGAFVPATGDLSESFNRVDLSDPVNIQEDHPLQLRTEDRAVEKADTPANDYEQFLQTSSTKAKPHARNSHFSTISSIISKQRKSSIRDDSEDDDDDEDEDEDDEIAKELQRQLDQIKTGSQVSLVSQGIGQSEDSFVTASGSFGHDAAVIPTFRISHETDKQSRADDSEPSDRDTDEETKINETNATSVDEDSGIEPLVCVQKSAKNDTEPFTPRFKAHFEDESILDTPETIKPLSPKTHSVEQELEDINFRCSQGEIEKKTHQQVQSPASEGQDDIEILGKNLTPSEFDAFPKSVIDPNYPAFRNSEVSRKAPPGTGPCRSCGISIDVEAKGSQKPIFSKSGDLSGQWHRGCFRCSYAGCVIQFNKNVTPYVLLDNAFCKHHYHTLNNTLCETCHSGIEGECIENELKQKWHLSCLKCTKCLESIRTDYFVVNHRIVCEADAGSLIQDLKDAGLTTSDKVEKRRTRMLFIE